MTTLYKVWCTSKTFDDFFHETFLVSAPTRWKEKNQTFKKSKKKICCDTKKKRIFCCFSLLQSYKHLNLKKKTTFLFLFLFFLSPGMFVSYFVQNRDKFNQIFWSHLELLKEDKHFVKKAPLPRPAHFRMGHAHPQISSSNQSLCCNYLTIARVRQFCHLKKTKRVQEKNANKKNIESQFDSAYIYSILSSYLGIK